MFDCFGELLFVFLHFVVGRLCHRASDKLSSLSEDPCHWLAVLVFCSFGLVLFRSIGMKPPLNPRVSVRLFILRW